MSEQQSKVSHSFNTIAHSDDCIKLILMTIPPFFLTRSPFHITCVMNLALSDSLVLCLKDCDVLGVMQEVLANKEVTEVVATNAVAVVALIYGSQESCPDADRLLTVHNVAGSLVAALNSCLDGDGMHGGLLWRLSHVLKIMQSLSSREHQATMLVHVGAIQAIMRALKVTGTDGGMDPAHDPLVDRDRSFVSLPSFASIGSMGNFSSKLLDVDLDVALTGCRTLASLSSFQPLIPLLRESGVNQAMTIFQGHLDLRVADAAQSCLFLLNKAYVGGSLRKEVSRVKSGDRMRRPNNLSNVSAEDPGGVQPFDEGIEGDFIDEDEDGLEEEEDLDYDVFLSHKRTDAKDFARALYNLLVLRGLKTFLDYEFRSELNDLAKIVSRCKNLIFVLTDNVLESEWCLKELESAVDHKVNVIFVTKEGSRWKDIHGNKVCDFPPQHLIDKLPEKVKGLMTRKAIAHSDEYYQAFVDTLLKKIYQGCLKANNTKAQESSQHVAEVSQASGKSVSLHFDDLKLHSSPSAAQVLAMRAIRSTSTAFSPLRDSSASVSAASSPFQANSILPATTEGGAGAVSMQMVAGPSHSFAMAQTASSSTPVSRVHSGGGSDMLSPPYPPPHPPPQASLSPNTYPSTFASSIPGLLSSHQASLDQTLGAIQTQIRGIASQMDDIHVSFPNDLSKAHRDLSSQMHHLTSDVDLVKRELGEVRSKVQNVEASMSRLQSSMDQILSMVSHQVVPQLSVMQAFQDGLIGPLSSAIINGAISSAAGPSLRHQQEQERFSSHQQYNDQAGSSSNLAPSMPSAEASSSPYPSPSSSCFSPSHPQASKASPSNVPFLPPLILSPPHASSSSSSASAMYQTTPASLASHATASSSPVAASGQQQQQQHPLPIQGTSSVLIVGNVKSNGLGVAGRKGGGWVTRS